MGIKADNGEKMQEPLDETIKKMLREAESRRGTANPAPMADAIKQLRAVLSSGSITPEQRDDILVRLGVLKGEYGSRSADYSYEAGREHKGGLIGAIFGTRYCYMIYRIEGNERFPIYDVHDDGLQFSDPPRCPSASPDTLKVAVECKKWRDPAVIVMGYDGSNPIKFCHTPPFPIGNRDLCELIETGKVPAPEGFSQEDIDEDMSRLADYMRKRYIDSISISYSTPVWLSNDKLQLLRGYTHPGSSGGPIPLFQIAYAITLDGYNRIIKAQKMK